MKKIYNFCIFADFDWMNIYWMQKLCEDSHITQYESCIMGIVKVTSQKQLTFLPLFSYIFVFFKKI